MRMRVMLHAALVAVSTAGALLSVSTPGAEEVRPLLRAAAQRMGGEAQLRSLRSIRYEGISRQNRLEQSERPEGPWFVDMIEYNELRDLFGKRVRSDKRIRGYSTANWWSSTDWTSLSSMVADGVGIQIQGKDIYPDSFDSVEAAADELALGPERILLTALDAPDVHLEADQTVYGMTHHVVAWAQGAGVARLFLNVSTSLPAVVELTRAYPYNVFWNPWGDVTTRTTFSQWVLEPTGLHLPRLWSAEMNGKPNETFVVSRVTLNPPLSAESFLVKPEIKDAFLKNKHTLDEAHFLRQPPVDLAPGVTLFPGSWNVTFVEQPEGVTILEAPISNGYVGQILAEARRRFPKKAFRIATTSDSWPHIGGVREAVAQGIAMFVLDLNQPILERLIASPHHFRPDALAKNNVAAKLSRVAEKTVVGSGPNRVELYPVRGTGERERQMVAYLPERRILYSSDVFTPNPDGTLFTPQYVSELANLVRREKLQPTTVFGMHYAPIPWNTVTNSLAKAAASP